MNIPLSVNKVFGEYLRQVRKDANLTQEELAFLAELDRTYISLLERGIKSPTLTTFFRLCLVLDQKPDVFIAHISDQIDVHDQGHSQDKNNT